MIQRQTGRDNKLHNHKIKTQISREIFTRTERELMMTLK